MSSNISFNFNFDLKDISDFNLSFMVDIGTKEWYNGQTKQDKNFLNEKLKTQIPRNKIFHINSLFFNILRHRREILSTYNCYYDEDSNSLSLILSEKFDYAYFTKEIMLNILEFVQKVNIETIYILISQNHKKLRKISQDLAIVGFRCREEEKLKTAEIEGNAYKVLFMPVKETFGEIEEVEL